MADPNNAYGRPAAQELSVREETKYRQKCRDLKRRINEVELNNEALVTKLARTKRFIRRARLERALLLEAMQKHARRDAASEGSPSPPASPSLETYSLDPANMPSQGDLSLDVERRSISPDMHRQRTPMHETQAYHTGPKYHTGPNHGHLSTNHASNQKDHKGTPATTSSTKKSKPPKDPKAPKRPKNAFLLFCELERDSIRAAATTENGEPVDIARELGRAWADMDDDARKPYRNMYEEDKVRYEKEMAVYEKPKDMTNPVKAEVSTERPGASVSTANSHEGSPKPRAGGFTAVNRM